MKRSYSINSLVFITEMKSVYSAVRTGSLNKAVLQHKLIGFYNRDGKVYSAVRTGSLNERVLQHKLIGFCNPD